MLHTYGDAIMPWSDWKVRWYDLWPEITKLYRGSTILFSFLLSYALPRLLTIYPITFLSYHGEIRPIPFAFPIFERQLLTATLFQMGVSMRITNFSLQMLVFSTHIIKEKRSLSYQGLRCWLYGYYGRKIGRFLQTKHTLNTHSYSLVFTQVNWKLMFTQIPSHRRL